MLTTLTLSCALAGSALAGGHTQHQQSHHPSDIVDTLLDLSQPTRPALTAEAQNELNRALIAAARAGKSGATRELLAAGADPNTHVKGRLPLVEAVTASDANTARVLLNAGATVDVRDSKGRTPLVQAASGGHIAELNLLLEAGAEVDFRDSDGDTALIAAAIYGKDTAARLLLDAGADIDARGRGKRTPLMAAAQFGKSNIASQLINAGANPTLTDSHHRTPLVRAARNGDAKTVRVIARAIAHQPEQLVRR